MRGWKRINANGFDLRLTLESGQFFRYTEERDDEREGTFLILTQGRALRVRQDGGELRHDGADAAFVKEFLGADGRQEPRIRRLEQDEALASLIQRYRGLRLMRQDLHETIIAFLCSSQSNIPKIRMNLHLIAHNSGIRTDGHARLPPPGEEIAMKTLIDAKTGYRAKFIAQTNRMLTPALLRRIRRADYAGSHALLYTLPGVGPKIADCVCLFALGHGEAFPVDVHVLRAMRTLFPEERFKDELAAKYFAQHRWGRDAGLAQQFIYQWARDTLGRRTHKKRGNKEPS